MRQKLASCMYTLPHAGHCSSSSSASAAMPATQLGSELWSRLGCRLPGGSCQLPQASRACATPPASCGGTSLRATPHHLRPPLGSKEGPSQKRRSRSQARGIMPAGRTSLGYEAQSMCSTGERPTEGTLPVRGSAPLQAPSSSCAMVCSEARGGHVAAKALAPGPAASTRSSRPVHVAARSLPAASSLSSSRSRHRRATGRGRGASPCAARPATCSRCGAVPGLTAGTVTPGIPLVLAAAGRPIVESGCGGGTPVMA
mmetsp:Transcript_70473/g.206181  ORF Transcript_70473/g.206181 Transcript_70473/m.206181 type:complete len:257 (-) Transcript_70473:690-1460(-)